MVSYHYYIVDAFTGEGLQGNPAAVILVETLPSEGHMEALAKHLAQPALAFLAHPSIHSPIFPLSQIHNHTSEPTVPEIRWYSARGEPLPLCGHATMATTMLLLSLFPTLNEVSYRFPRGILAARRLTDGRAEIDLPASARLVPLDDVAFARAVSTISRSAGIEEREVVYLGAATSNDPSKTNILIRLHPSTDLSKLSINADILGTLPYRGFYFTSPWEPTSSSGSQQSYAFCSRVFFPAITNLEDQVCGSAHTLLGPYWAESESEVCCEKTAQGVLLEARQVSERGGEVGMRWDGRWREDGGICCLRGTGIVSDQGDIHLDS